MTSNHKEKIHLIFARYLSFAKILACKLNIGGLDNDPSHPAGGSVDSVDFAPCSKFCLLGELLLAAIFKGTSM